MNFPENFKEQLITDGILTLKVKIHAGAKQTACKSVLSDGTIKIDVVKIAEGGQANGTLINFLAREFNVPKNNIEIIMGKFSGDKIVKISQ